MRSSPSIRVGLPRAAQLGITTQFACDSGFLRQARVSPAAPLGELATAWIEGTALMPVRVRGRIDGQAHLELGLGTSLHGASDPRDAATVIEGAPLAEWRAASRPVQAALARALAAAGFAPQP